LLVDAEGERATCRVEKLPAMPQGTGDLLTAFFAAALLDGLEARAALGLAVARLEIICKASSGKVEPVLIASMDEWRKAAPLAVDDA
jgi:pyridoxal/pyridoxine/pyridoxamine kinase